MKTSTHTFDIITLGQSYVDLIGEQIGSSLKDMMSFKKHVGGMASYARGFSRLGLNTALMSAVGNDDFGQFILDAMAHEKVDVSQVRIDKDHASAFMFKAIENKKSFPFLSYSKQCAGIVDTQLTDTSLINQSTALFINSASISSETISVIKKAISIANENQIKIILALDIIDDKNQDYLLKTMSACSLVIGAEQDFHALSGTQDSHQALSQLRALTSAIFVMKNAFGCFAFSQIPSDLMTSPHHAGFVNDNHIPFMSKASFMIGYVATWLKGISQEKSCEYAMACLALTQSREEHSDSLPTIDALNIFLSSQTQVVQTIRTPLFDHIHYAATRANTQDQLFTFSFGSHAQWLKLAETANVDEDVIIKAKMLIASGIQQVASMHPNVSMMTEAYPEREIMDTLPSPHRLMRGLDVPGAVPLEIQGDPDITHTLLTWPQHHSAKLSLVYHPDDRYALRQQQETTLNLLYLAARRTHHELVIELSPATNSIITASTMSHIMQRLYEIGIYPDWWQVMPPRDPRAFENMQRVIHENDRLCKGVLLLSHHATFEQLPAMFNCAKHDICKGFVVDKSLFQVALNQWLGQLLNNQAFVDTVSRSFEKAINLWEQAKATAIEKAHTAKVG
ncbi:MAG: PfkB family carbohydrate kinase [Candidatus Berkiella sp.]